MLLLMVGYSSGQRGQTVNLLAYAFQGSNPCPTTNHQTPVNTGVFAFLVRSAVALFYPVLVPFILCGNTTKVPLQNAKPF